MKLCRVCSIELTLGENWTTSMQKSYSNICLKCERERQKNPKYRETQKKYYLNNKEYLSLQNKQYQIENKEKIQIQRKEYYSLNSEKISIRDKKKRMEIRYDIISYYTDGIMKCMCPGCNEDHLDFLTIDHINNDGAEHRKEIGDGGSNLYYWIYKNNFPEGFQVLCMNCNFSKGKHGHCSKHQ